MTTAQNLAGISQLVSAYNSPLGVRNRIINGCMRIAQRGNTTHTAGSIAYGAADRWYVYTAGSSITSDNTWQAPPSKAALHLVGASGNTASTVGQRIESMNIWDMAGQTMTLSGYVWSSTGTIPNLAIGTPTSSDNFGTVNWSATVPALTALTASTWTRFTYTFVVPAGATNGLAIEIQFGALGASQQAAVSGIQLEAGPVATNFELRPIGIELTSCQRYFEVVALGGITAYNQTNSASLFTVPFAANKRVSPTLTTTALNTFSNENGIATISNITIDRASTSHANLLIAGSSGGAAASCSRVIGTGALYFNAEL